MSKDRLVETWEILESKDYDKFKFKKDNRDVNKGSVDKIKSSIEKYGYVRANIVKVDGRFNIIDGQHTFTACKELGLPILYTKIDYLTSNDMKALNIAGMNWRLGDFVKHNSKNGHKPSKLLLEAIEYGELYDINVDKVLYMMFGTKQEDKVKTGNFEITTDMNNLFMDRVNNYVRILEYKDRIIFARSPNDVTKLFSIISHNVTTNLLIEELKRNEKLTIDLTKSKRDFDYDKYFTNILGKNDTTLI